MRQERDTYDVIVVGSGSTGGALAARLSEDDRCRVLVLEAGPSYRSVGDMPAELRLPASIAAAAPGHPNNWAYRAELRPGVTVAYARGKGLGGSSSINGCSYMRATPADFAAWSALGNPDWSYEHVLPYFKRSETDHDFGGAYHGDAGPIPVRREPRDRAPAFTAAFDAACRGLGFAADPDKNAPSDGGVGPVPMNVGGGLRVGTAIGYLRPALGRPNLRVVGDALVRRVITAGGRAVGVDAVVGGAPRTFHAGEIVICAGALRSPHLLMLSGIGPAVQLRRHGIGVVEDLAGVGQNLTDHPMVLASWEARVPLPRMMDRGIMTSALHWEAEGSPLELLPFVARERDMLSGASVRGTGHAGMAIVAFRTDSRGSVTLVSPDPRTMPRLRWNLLAAAVDRRRLRAAVQTAAQVYRAGPMRDIGARIVGLTDRVLADPHAIDAWVAGLVTGGHPSCTCRMGPASDPSAVVDQSLAVHGVAGLRVADTSVFPAIPSRGPSATAVMVGERLADLLRTGGS